MRISTLLILASLLTNFAAAAPEQGYLFCSFRGNGEDGLHLAYSEDGLKWTPLNDDKSYLDPRVGSEKLMRDPCITVGADGEFHMVWTTGWKGSDIGYAHSKDLIRWSPQRAIPVMGHEPKAVNCWAPEVIYDPAKEQFVIFWSTSIPGRFATTDGEGEARLNHRIYRTTTKDFESFTPTELFFDPGFSVIDGTIVQDKGKVYLVFKDERVNPLKKHLHVAGAESVDGPFGQFSEAFTPTYSEGPTVLRVGDQFICYFDLYRQHKYGGMRTRDFKTWEDVSDHLGFPKGTRHGTAFPVSQKVLDGLMKMGGKPNAPAGASSAANGPAADRGRTPALTRR